MSGLIIVHLIEGSEFSGAFFSALSYFRLSVAQPVTPIDYVGEMVSFYLVLACWPGK